MTPHVAGLTLSGVDHLNLNNVDRQLLEESATLRGQVAEQAKQIIILRHEASQGRGPSGPDAPR